METIGRYADTPRKLVIELVDNEYVNLGTTESMDHEAAKAKVLEVLGSDPKDINAIVAKTGLSRKSVDRAIQDLGSEVLREGDGVKGDPYTYRRA